MNVLVLPFGEIFFTVYLAAYSTCNVVTTISDAFKFADLAQHCTDIRFGFITQMGITHLIEILRYFNFHIVADAFILFDACKKFDESAIVGRTE